MVCIYRYSVIKNHFNTLKTPTSTKALTTDIFTVSIVLPFADCHILGIKQYGAFQDWLLSLSNMHLEFLHVFSWLGSPVLFIVEYYTKDWMHHNLFTYPAMEVHLDCFQFGAIMNKTAMNICRLVFVWV